MSKQREALEMALEALIEVTGWQWHGPMRVIDEVEDAITAIREVLAEPEQDPVAWRIADERDWEYCTKPPLETDIQWSARYGRKYEPLYTAPPPRKPLTDEELTGLRQGKDKLNFVTLREFRVIARAIERAHGITQ